MKKGLFITVEGIEGAGKSTNLRTVRSLLEELGQKVEVTREPGGTPFAEEIRELLLSPRDEAVSGEAELLLMFAARAQHLQGKIFPLLREGVHVISDRFTDATYAYQGGGRGLDIEKIAVLEKLVQSDFRPDLTLLLTIPVEIGLERARKRGALDRFEQEKVQFYERVQEVYLQRAQKEPERFLVIDAENSLEYIQQQIASALTSRIQALIG